MSAAELGPWEPLDIDSVVDTFRHAPFRWWISGGHALDLHLGRTWREHEDTDVGVVRQEADAVYAFLGDWDLHIAAAGQLSPWRGEPLEEARHQNNVWCRREPGGPWVLDLTIGEGSDDCWIFRRDASVHIPWCAAVLQTDNRIAYLAPDLQLLFKSKGLRPKDDVDAVEVVPSLDRAQRERLARLLEPNHPWQLLLTSTST